MYTNYVVSPTSPARACTKLGMNFAECACTTLHCACIGIFSTSVDSPSLPVPAPLPELVAWEVASSVKITTHQLASCSRWGVQEATAREACAAILYCLPTDPSTTVPQLDCPGCVPRVVASNSMTVSICHTSSVGANDGWVELVIQRPRTITSLPRGQAGAWQQTEQDTDY